MYQFKKQLGFALPLVILIVAIVIIAGGVGYYFYKTSQEQKEGEIAGPEQVIDETADWKTYRNEKYGFEIKYPTNYWLYGDLLLNEETKMFYADPVIVNLNKNLTRKEGVNNEEIYTNVTEFTKRPKTIKEACDLTGEKDCPLRPLSQEEIIQTKNKLKSAKIGEAVYDLNNKVMGNIIESNGIKMIYSVSFSPQSGYYGAQSIIYSDGNDLIKLYVYLIDAESQTQAENDEHNKIFNQILSTLKFIEK